MQKQRRGFTLVELLIVAAVIAILSAIAIPILLRSRISANEAAAIGDLRDVLGSSPPDPFSGTKSGYRRGCTAGVYWATPLVQGKTGVRGFGIDGTGRICFTNDGSIPNMAGTCDTFR